MGCPSSKCLREDENDVEEVIEVSKMVDDDLKELVEEKIQDHDIAIDMEKIKEMIEKVKIDVLEDEDNNSEQDTKEMLKMHCRDAKKIGISWSDVIQQQKSSRPQFTIYYEKNILNGNIFYVEKEKRIDAIRRRTIHE
uniref:uncharacterized protein LOC120333080 n=1 Tax=Styela clava TaxID=7725 RepID=UPI00193984A2|nr:uncharacterized protein LOC120333080 [Styela clava]